MTDIISVLENLQNKFFKLKDSAEEGSIEEAVFTEIHDAFAEVIEEINDSEGDE